MAKEKKVTTPDDALHPPLVWVDLEMTGLNFSNDVILEIAVLVTDADLNIMDEGIDLVISQSEKITFNMDNWNTQHHTESGLLEKVRNSSLPLSHADTQCLEYIKRFTEINSSPICGNSVWVDRIFLKKDLPSFEEYLHYRVIDVTSIKELVYRWYPDLPKFEKKDKHTALKDIHNSIDELKYYRKHIFREHADQLPAPA